MKSLRNGHKKTLSINDKVFLNHNEVIYYANETRLKPVTVNPFELT